MKDALQIRDIYTQKEERMVTAFFHRLSEKERRAFAAIEATRIGFGGISLVSQLFGCSRPTVHRGLKEFEDGTIAQSRVRKKGAGRKSVFESHQNLESLMDEILKDTLAGDPMNPDVFWTHLSVRDIGVKLKAHGIKLSENTVRLVVKKTLGKTKGAQTIRYRQVRKPQ